MASPVTELVDLGPCGWCTDGQWDHRQGKKGCKVPGCGCGKYEPPKDRPAPAAVLEVDPSSEVPGELVDGLDGPDLGVCVGGFEPAQPGDVDLTPVDEPEPDEVEPDVHFMDGAGNCALDCPGCGLTPVDEPEAEPVPVVADPGAQAEHAEQVAAIDAQLAAADEPESVAAATVTVAADEWDHLVAEVVHLREQNGLLRKANIELGRAEADNQHLARSLRETAGERDRAQEALREWLRADLQTEIDRLRDELDRANTGRQKAQDALDDAVRTGTAAAAAVLFRYDAGQCTTEGCGSRYTVPVEHEHPLTPVTVLVVRREVPGA